MASAGALGGYDWSSLPGKKCAGTRDLEARECLRALIGAVYWTKNMKKTGGRRQTMGLAGNGRKNSIGVL